MGTITMQLRESATVRLSWKQLEKKLDAVTAGRTAHRPTLAHPYADCFGYGRGKHDGTKHAQGSCEAFIRAAQQCEHPTTVYRITGSFYSYACTSCGQPNLRRTA